MIAQDDLLSKEQCLCFWKACLIVALEFDIIFSALHLTRVVRIQDLFLSSGCSVDAFQQNDL